MIIKETITMMFTFPACAEDFCDAAANFAKELGFELKVARNYVSFVVEYDDEIPETIPNILSNKSKLTEAMFWYECGWNEGDI